MWQAQSADPETLDAASKQSGCRPKCCHKPVLSVLGAQWHPSYSESPLPSLGVALSAAQDRQS